MSADELRQSTVTVTLILRDDCPACFELLRELEPFSPGVGVVMNRVNLSTDDLPAFAQGVIVPATYIGNTLWRHGAYPALRLMERIKLERERNGLLAD